MHKFVALLGFCGIFCSTEVYADEALRVGWQEIEQNYVEKISSADIALIALKSLNKIDKKIQVANDGTRITLYYNTKVFRNFTKPEGKISSEWMELVERVIASALKVSTKMALKDYEISDVILKSVVASLDVDSKYHTAFELADDEAFERKRYFASRKIDDILYVRMLGFNDDTAKLFSEILKQENMIKGLILDLRGNKGGALSSMVQIANMLLDGGIMFESSGRDDNMNLLYEADKGDMLANRPIVVLVDGNTASSAEILAGVLHEQSRADLVGATTYGKSTSQKVVKLPNESVLMLTNAYLSLPSGKDFSKIGLMPDYCLNESENFDVLKKSKDCRKEDREGQSIDIEAAIEVLKLRI